MCSVSVSSFQSAPVMLSVNHGEPTFHVCVLMSFSLDLADEGSLSVSWLKLAGCTLGLVY